MTTQVISTEATIAQQIIDLKGTWANVSNGGYQNAMNAVKALFAKDSSLVLSDFLSPDDNRKQIVGVFGGYLLSKHSSLTADDLAPFAGAIASHYGEFDHKLESDQIVAWFRARQDDDTQTNASEMVAAIASGEVAVSAQERLDSVILSYKKQINKDKKAAAVVVAELKASIATLTGVLESIEAKSEAKVTA